MSINCLLTNDVVLDKLVALVDAKSGNVSSIAGLLPIDVAPTAGDVIVSLPIGGTWTATNNVLTSTAPDALEWGTDAGGGGGISTATLPLVVALSDISLPIAGIWTATNNVVKSTASNALEWGVDGPATAPIITTHTCFVLANPWFFHLNAGGGQAQITYNQVVTPISATYTYAGDLVDSSLLIDNSVAITDLPLFSFIIPTPFLLTTTYSYPSQGSTVFGNLLCGTYIQLAPVNATSSQITVIVSGLVCPPSTIIDFHLPTFTIYNGM